jgi:hypothetical protein
MLHDPASRPCAQAIAKFIGAPWVLPGDAEPVWLRDLPRSLPARPGVIELWLPPVGSAVSADSAQAEQRVGGPDPLHQASASRDRADLGR